MIIVDSLKVHHYLWCGGIDSYTRCTTRLFAVNAEEVPVRVLHTIRKAGKGEWKITETEWIDLDTYIDTLEEAGTMIEGPHNEIVHLQRMYCHNGREKTDFGFACFGD